MNKHIIAPHQFKHEPVGECIYCGELEGLTDEHIIPYALGGTIILPKSSCHECSKVTSKIERSVLRGFMYQARVVGNFPSRRKGKYPKEIPMKFISKDEVIFQKQVKKSEALAVIHLPLFEYPAIFCDRDPTETIQLTGMETVHFGKSPKEVFQVNQAVGVQFQDRMLLMHFVRLLAKIAYCTAIADFGKLERSESPLLPIIRGERKDVSNWIGSSDFNPQTKSKNPLHLLGSEKVKDSQEREGIAVKIRLFSNFPTTGYLAAAHVHGWQSYFSDELCRRTRDFWLPKSQ